MCMLSIGIKNLCVGSVRISVTYACTEHTREKLLRTLIVCISFPIFQICLYILSICIMSLGLH
jgi:hypothetical protein